MVLCTALFFAFIVGKAVLAQRKRAVTGREGLVGEIGVVKRALSPTGMVLVQGELWEASAEGEPVEAGERVRVLQMEGLRLKVARI